MRVTIADLKKIAPTASVMVLAELAHSAPLLEEFEINTPLRLSHFLAQCAHESDGFKTTTEYASGVNYEFRRDLGNVNRGDGVRYRGRGLIQLTGRTNYKKFTTWIQARMPEAPDFVAFPELVAEFPWALLSAVYYWDVHGLNMWADRNEIEKITKIVNGGYRGLDQRKRYFNAAWRTIGRRMEDAKPSTN